MKDLSSITRRTFLKLVGTIIGIIIGLIMIAKMLATNKVGQITNLKTFNISIVHRLTDSNSGKSFVIPNFSTNCLIKEIRVRANYTSGQRRIWTVFINEQNGIGPNDTRIPYRGRWDSSPVGEFAYLDNEIVYISEDNGSTLTVTRGVKGTVPSYYDYNTPIRIANNGLRLILYKDNHKRLVDNLKIMDRIMAWKGEIDAWIGQNDRLIKFKDNILNVGKYDILYIVGTIPERAIVENVNNDTKIVSVSDPLSAYIGNVEVQKQIIYNDLMSYSGEINLYGILFIDEKIDDTVIVDIDILIQ